jgi:hypothetical protein
MGSIATPLKGQLIVANGSAPIQNENGYNDWSDYTQLLTQLEAVAG